MYIKNIMMLTDGYKLDHRRQLPPKTTFMVSNMTARSSRVPGSRHVVFWGLQYYLMQYMQRAAFDTFFDRPRSKVLSEYEHFLNRYLPQGHNITVEHIDELRSLRYMPLMFRALEEGTHVPLRVPMFTVENTHANFAWLVNYFETLMSNVLWQPITSATTAYRYRTLFNEYARITDPDSMAFVPYQGHDFSFRGMPGVESAILSGAGHALSFVGSDTPAVLEFFEDYYITGESKLVAGVPATEHAVMCAGGRSPQEELRTFERLMRTYPSGVLSVVSDTWDLWNVVDYVLPALREQIMARDGKLVIRPDSGNPADILCGAKGQAGSAGVGLIERLFDLFGGTINKRGYKVLNPHIGAIYGDSITYDRAQEICQRLEAKQFASTNVVLGIGSYTYQYVTRDTYGQAIKATYARIDGNEHQMFKNPKTDDGTKRSACGRMIVYNDGLGLHMQDDLDQAAWSDNQYKDLLNPVWINGSFIDKRHSLTELRERVAGGPDEVFTRGPVRNTD